MQGLCNSPCCACTDNNMKGDSYSTVLDPMVPFHKPLLAEWLMLLVDQQLVAARCWPQTRKHLHG
jgi:hypothetical protein